MSELQVPPHDLTAEAAVLSAVLLDGQRVDELVDLLKPEHFYSEAHRRAFEACLALRSIGQPVDIVQVGTWLKDHGRIEQVGGLPYLTEILNSAPYVANVRAYGQTVRDKAQLRALLSIGHRTVANCYGDVANCNELIDSVAKELADLASCRPADSLTHVKDALRSAIKGVQARSSGGPATTLASTGIEALDWRIGGLAEGRVYVVAGRPGMGKSALAFGIATHIAKQGHGVLGFSLEMPNEELALRMMSGEAGINNLYRKLDPDEMSRATTAAMALAKCPNFYLDDKAGMTIAEIRAKMAKTARLIGTAKLGLVVVDYLQLCKGAGRDNREQQIAEISRSLKELAKEFKTPVIALSQLNRGCESRDDKRPMLGDLRESGSIEQDADCVLFVYRDKKYNPDSKFGDIVELIVSKQRNGPEGTAYAAFDARFTRFRDATYSELEAAGVSNERA